MADAARMRNLLQCGFINVHQCPAAAASPWNEPRPRKGTKSEATILQNNFKSIADLLNHLPFASVGRACGCKIVVERYPVDVGQGFRRTPNGNNKRRQNNEEGCDSEGEDDEVVRLPSLPSERRS